jgi:hypothetical protein
MIAAMDKITVLAIIAICVLGVFGMFMGACFLMVAPFLPR